MTRRSPNACRVIAAVACLLYLSAGRADSNSANYQQLLAGVQSSPFGAQQCQDMAVAFGDWVVGQRDSETAATMLLDGRKLGERLHSNCRAAIRDIEGATNEDEAALESLYRSELWYDLNRALASLRYWQAWLDLSLAAHGAKKETRVTSLQRAQRGFQASSLRILYPGLVYGSWLGLAYVAQLQEDTVTMKQRLMLLKRALEADPDNPLHDIVDTELGLLALQVDGADTIEITDDEPLNPATARLLEEQAFLQLERRRKENSGGFAAAKNLRRLIDQGFLDDRLFARILSYKDEIVGFELGPIAYLVEAEFAYAYQQYETAVLKFQAFLASDAVNTPLDLTVFSYHYAVALYELGLYRDAMAMIEELREADAVPGELRIPLAKLRFIVAEALYQDDPSSLRANSMRIAARDYIASASADPDIASAHLALARIEGDDLIQAQHLAQAAADPQLRDNVLAVELELAVAKFQHSASSARLAEVQASAAVALGLLESLPGEQRDALAMQVLAVQLGSVLAAQPDDILARIAALSKEPDLNPTQWRVLEWAQLRLIDRLQGHNALRQYVGQRVASATTAFDHELYVLLREFEAQGRDEQLANLASLWLPALVDTPQLRRQVWMLYIAALRSTGRDPEALAAIHNMLAVFPDSGDAWRQLAEQSRHMGDTFAAERALAHIAAAEPAGSPRWIDVSLQRLQLLAMADNEGARTCALAHSVQVYNHRMQLDQVQMLAVLSRDMGCPQQEE